MKGATEFLKWVSQTGINNLVWCTDLDHTVLDTHIGSHLVRANSGLEDNFRALDRATEGRFYVITGREMAFIDSNFPNTKLKASSEYHNVMRWETNGKETAVRPLPQWSLIDEELQDIIEEFWPESYRMRPKPYMRSIHYNQAPALNDPLVKEHVIARLQMILDKYHAQTGQKLENIDGGHVFDIAPQGSSKGTAIQEIMKRSHQNCKGRALTPVYFGDSPGDIPAAIETKKLGGKFVAVGNHPDVLALADFHIQGPALCRALFQNAVRVSPTAPRYRNDPTPPAEPTPSWPEGPEAP